MASGLTTEIVLDLIKQGVTQAEIGRRYGVSRQAVNALAKRGGGILPCQSPWTPTYRGM